MPRFIARIFFFALSTAFILFFSFNFASSAQAGTCGGTASMTETNHFCVRDPITSKYSCVARTNTVSASCGSGTCTTASNCSTTLAVKDPNERCLFNADQTTCTVINSGKITRPASGCSCSAPTCSSSNCFNRSCTSGGQSCTCYGVCSSGTCTTGGVVPGTCSGGATPTPTPVCANTCYNAATGACWYCANSQCVGTSICYYRCGTSGCFYDRSCTPSATCGYVPTPTPAPSTPTPVPTNL